MARFKRISELNKEGVRVIRVKQMSPEEEARADAWENRVPPTKGEIVSELFDKSDKDKAMLELLLKMWNKINPGPPKDKAGMLAELTAVIKPTQGKPAL